MEKIIVNTQAELDAVPQDFDGEIEIRGGAPFEPIVVKSERKSSAVTVYDSAVAEVYGSAIVRAYNSAIVMAYDFTKVLAFDSAYVVAYDSVNVEAHDSVTVVAYNTTKVSAYNSVEVWANNSTVVEAFGSANVGVRDSARICARDSVIVKAHDSAAVWAHNSVTIEAYNSALVRAYDTTSIKAYDSVTIKAFDSTIVEAYKLATVEACNSTTVEAYGFSQVIKYSHHAIIVTHEQARCIDPTADINTFCTYYSIQRNKKKSIWYKAVHKRGEKYIADYDQRTTYTIGETKTVENLNKNRNETCGAGIHIAPLNWAIKHGGVWSDLAILEVEAVTNDIILPYHSSGKVRVDKIKVLREVPLEECGIFGKMIAKEKENK